MKKEIASLLVLGSILAMASIFACSKAGDGKEYAALSAKITKDVMRFHKDTENTRFNTTKCVMSVASIDEQGTTIQLVPLGAIERFEGDESKRQSRFTTKEDSVNLRRVERTGDMKKFDSKLLVLDFNNSSYESGAATAISKDIESLASMCKGTKSDEEVLARVEEAKGYSLASEKEQTPVIPQAGEAAEEKKKEMAESGNDQKELRGTTKEEEKGTKKRAENDLFRCSEKFFMNKVVSGVLTHNDLLLMWGTACTGSLEGALMNGDNNYLLDQEKRRVIIEESRKFSAIPLYGEDCIKFSQNFDITGNPPKIKLGDILLYEDENSRLEALVTNYDPATITLSIMLHDPKKGNTIRNFTNTKITKNVEGRTIVRKIFYGMSVNKKICEE